MTTKDIFALTRTNPQGKTALGFGVILLVMGVMIVGGLYVLNILKLPEKKDPTVKIKTPSSQATRKGTGSPVAQPLILDTEIADPKHKPQGINLETLVSKTQAKPTNTVAAATNNAFDGFIPHFDTRLPGSGRSPDGKIGLSARGTASSPEAAGEAEPNYYYVDKLLAVSEGPAKPAPKKTGFESHRFLPRGHKIPIILLNNINTSLGTLPVEMAVAKDVFFNGRLQLPFGWKLYGQAAGSANLKVNVNANTIVDPLGREYPINAMILNLDHEPGFTGYALESPFLLQALPIAQSTLKIFMDAAKNVYNQQSVVPAGNGLVVAEEQKYALDAKNKLIDATAAVLQQTMGRKIHELTMMYPEGTMVPRGTLGWLYLQSPLDMTIGEVGGSTKFLQETNLNIRPNVLNSVDINREYNANNNPMNFPALNPENLQRPGILYPDSVRLPPATQNSSPSSVPGIQSSQPRPLE